MPTASRNERKKRRMKRTNSLLKKQIRNQQEAFQRYAAYTQQMHLIFMTVLGQSGGEIRITKGTIEQAQLNLQNLSYSVTPTENTDVDGVSAPSNEYVVRLVTQEEPSVTLVDSTGVAAVESAETPNAR